MQYKLLGGTGAVALRLCLSMVVSGGWEVIAVQVRDLSGRVGVVDVSGPLAFAAVLAE